MKDSLFGALDPTEKQDLWGWLDALLEFHFDFAKVVICEIDSDNVAARDWEKINILCWTDRQGNNKPIGDPLSIREVKWLARHIGEEEASKIQKDFGMKDMQAAILYCINYPDNDQDATSSEYFASFCRDL